MMNNYKIFEDNIVIKSNYIPFSVTKLNDLSHKRLLSALVRTLTIMFYYFITINSSSNTINYHQLVKNILDNDLPKIVLRSKSNIVQVSVAECGHR